MSIAGILTGIVMLLVCVGMLILPFVRHRQLFRDAIHPLKQQYDSLLLDLATLEDDYRQGLYPEADYATRRDNLRQQAIHILQQLDALPPSTEEHRAADSVEKLIASYRQQEHK
ncbi:MAG: hypothetical protein ACOYLB_10265 [Phototrophicaceae bacterium]